MDQSYNPAGIAPAPMFPERTPTRYERKAGLPGERRGPLRFQEGLASDTDVPMDFIVGAQQGHVTAPGRLNHNAKVDTKYPQETLKQRAHVGSASWVEAPQHLAEFAHGSFGDYGALTYERVFRPEAKTWYPNASTVND